MAVPQASFGESEVGTATSWVTVNALQGVLWMSVCCYPKPDEPNFLFCQAALYLFPYTFIDPLKETCKVKLCCVWQNMPHSRKFTHTILLLSCWRNRLWLKLKQFKRPFHSLEWNSIPVMSQRNLPLSRCGWYIWCGQQRVNLVPVIKSSPLF